MTPTDPDPTATELAPPQTRAECVAWLRARAERFKEDHKQALIEGDMLVADERLSDSCSLEIAAADLAAGERP